MLLINLIHHFITLILILSCRKSASEIAMSLPGCPDKCGDIPIPYPFGTKKHCCLNPDYQVDCKTLQLAKANFKLINISLEGLIHAVLPIAYECYNQTGGIVTSSQPIIQLSRFRLPWQMNVLTTVGCDTRTDLTDVTGDYYIAGCITGSSCGSTYGSCIGNGCMQVPLPYSLTTFQIHVERSTTSVRFRKGSRSTNCTYGFLVERHRYTFDPKDVDNMHRRSLPVALKWTVGNTTCEQAKKNERSFVCSENSVCLETTFLAFKFDLTAAGHLGYNCRCAPGYHGNPYLPNGCQDINECEGPLNDCIYGENICVNIYGNYTCTCPKGMHGDGRKLGSGCSPLEAATLLESSLYIAMSIGTTISVVLTFILYCGLKQRRTMKIREMLFKNNGGLILQKVLFDSRQSSHTTKIFAANILEKATNNFHKSNVIGQGAYGTVYKGTLEDKTMVAIKKSKSIDTNQIEQFINEVIMLADLSHPYVVRLLGCCLDTQTPLLVYEYITNKTLYHHLHEKYDVASMAFERRLNIATQTAKALAHIHSTTQVIHRDIKSSNILLTDDYTVKVSDFGISRFIPVDQTHIQTLVHGTLGYIDPEYFRSGILTDKSDVYSFGMVLVELITGRKVFSHDGTESDLGLAMFFVSFLERGCLIKILDDQVNKYEIFDHIIWVAKLAKHCIELEGKKRPSMEAVKEELEKLKLSFIKSSISC